MSNRKRAATLTYSLSTVILAAGAPHLFAQNPGVTLSVDVNANRKVINPNIYGVAFATTANLTDLNTVLNRYGGNTTSRYNWQLNADNKGSDWYFESIPSASSVQGEAGDTFISNTKAAGAQAMVTIPMLSYIANVGTGRTYLWSFSIAKYGAQTGKDSYYPDAGNGVSTASGNPYITGNNPLDANVANTAANQLSWMQHIKTKWGAASAGGLKYYIMDNEHGLWNSTHRDVHPAGATMDEVYNDIVTYAGNVKTNDPTALVVGPEEWGWTGYLYSGSDAAYAGLHGWGTLPDRNTHGGMDYLPWLLQQMKAYDTAHSKRLLDVFSLHWYPQSGEFSSDDSAAMQLNRNKSTRSLWDPSYTDISWVNAIVQLIPRMKNWVATYYPGTLCALTEYNWGDEPNINGATTQADIFGIFGREGLDMACRWTTPDPATPTYKAMKMYRNYDGAKSTFGDTSVKDTGGNPDQLSSFAAQRSSDNAVTVMVINKISGTTPVTINLANFTGGATAQRYQLTSGNVINHLSDIAVTGGTSLSDTVPSQSITLYIVPKSAAAQYDFEIGTQNWTFNTAPITGVSQSTTQHFAGTHALAVTINGAAGVPTADVALPGVVAGKVITFHVWVPSGSQVTGVQPYIMDNAWLWTGTFKAIGTLTPNAWNTFTVTVPSNAAMPIQQLGVQFTTGATWSGTCYVDAVSW